MYETFESLPLALTFTGTWERSTVSPYLGKYCYKSAAIGNGQSSQTSITITGSSSGTYISFFVRVSSDNINSFDYFKFYVDDVVYYQSLGENPWRENVAVVGPGLHTLKWEYVKDDSGSAGEDAAYIDNIHIFNLGTVDFIADTNRRVLTDFTAGSLSADTKRHVVFDSVAFSAKTERKVTGPISFHADTKRRLTNIAQFSGETKRRLAFAPTGVKAISITMAAKTLSDTFTLDTVDPKNINDCITGELMGYTYQFLVESTEQTEDVQKITGMYDVDLLLCTPIKYTIPASAGAITHIEKIASAIGKTAAVRIDDFTPSNTVATVGASYKNIISSLFGWTSDLPQRQVNVFLRGNILHAVQRGKEAGTVVITAPYSRPTVSKKLIRTMWSGGSGTTVGTSLTFSSVPFSGTISFGDCTAGYAGGLLVSETFSGGSSSYSYSGDFLVRKNTQTSDAIVETVYDYGATITDRILGVETETTTYLDSSGAGSGTKVRVTRHAPLGNGFWGTTVEEDGLPVGSSISTGRPGCKASKYYVDTMSRSLGSPYSKGDDSGGGASLPGTALINTDFPLAEISILRELTAAIEWLNGKTEERVAMEVYEHALIDFTTTVTYNGQVYYLEKNTVTKNARESKQAIELVRWY